MLVAHLMALFLVAPPWPLLTDHEHNAIAFTTIRLLATDAEVQDLHEQAWRESRFHHDAVSEAGCCGLWQVSPRWHDTTCERLIDDPVHSAVMALRVYRRMRVLCGDSWAACYEMGPWHPSNRGLLAARFR